MLHVQVMDEFRDDLRVGLGLEEVAALLEELLDVLVVCDDPVVDDDEGVLEIRAVRMRIEFAGRAVGSPTGVRNSAVRDDRTVKIVPKQLLGDGVLENLHLSGLLDQNDSLAIIGVDRNPSRVIAAILQALQAGHQQLKNLATCLRRQVV